MKELLKEIERLQKGTLMAHADGTVTQVRKPRKIRGMRLPILTTLKPTVVKSGLQ